ncbi:MAG: M20/M25/M40 family metallo-hydrolase [candidate division Zixibacteria bacterium]|nr:M20/M25/M40 family metallo-hydrolase [candidate division Zixibacteria bacterium]
MKQFIVLVFCLATLVPAVSADEIYRVIVASETDAKDLVAAGVQPLLRLNDGYLVLADSDAAQALLAGGLEARRVAVDVTLEELALDMRMDRANTGRYPLIYDEDGIRLYRVNLNDPQYRGQFVELRALDPAEVRIEYLDSNPYASLPALKSPRSMTLSLDSLIARISLDTIQAQLNYLQTLYRVAGSSGYTTARNWAYNKFSSYGYDSLFVQPFVSSIYGTPTNCYNVVATKVGASFPNHYVIVGGHLDAVPGSPGADDNGTGSIAVLEIARALADVPTEMTMVFVLFDAEEWGLYGAKYYADQAALRGDTIVYMLNMDMIGHYQNSNQANLFHGAVTDFSELWMGLADSLVGITGELAGVSASSDHYPFQQKGWEVTFVHEYNFSTVYHSPQDSTTYVNFDYFHRMTQASAATAYYVSEQAGWTSFSADTTVGWVPFTVNFTGNTQFNALSWAWSFGDGDSAFVQTPSHEYTESGLHTVSMQISTGDATRELIKPNYIVALADSMVGPQTQNAVAGTRVVVDVRGRNTVPVNYLEVPVEYTGTLGAVFDSATTVGTRASHMQPPVWLHWDPARFRKTVMVQSVDANPASFLPPGDGLLIRLHFTVPGDAQLGESTFVNLGGYTTHLPVFHWKDLVYNPKTMGTVLSTGNCCIGFTGNTDNDTEGTVDLGDLMYLVNHIFLGGAAPVCPAAANVNGDSECGVDLSDLIYLVNFLFLGGPEPAACNPACE